MILGHSYIQMDGELFFPTPEEIGLIDVLRMLCSQQVATLQRFMEYGLLDRQEANKILPNMSIPPTSDGESLMVGP